MRGYRGGVGQRDGVGGAVGEGCSQRDGVGGAVGEGCGQRDGVGGAEWNERAGCGVW